MAMNWARYGEMDSEEQGVQDMVLDDDDDEEIVAAAVGDEGLEESGVVDMDLDLSDEEEAAEETEQHMARPLEEEQENREQQTVHNEEQAEAEEEEDYQDAGEYQEAQGTVEEDYQDAGEYQEAQGTVEEDYPEAGEEDDYPEVGEEDYPEVGEEDYQEAGGEEDYQEAGEEEDYREAGEDDYREAGEEGEDDYREAGEEEDDYQDAGEEVYQDVLAEEEENHEVEEQEKQQEEARPALEEQQSRNAGLRNTLKTGVESATPQVKTDKDDLLSLEKRIFFCQICQVPCLSESILQLHYRGAKHKKREKAMKTEMFLGMAMRNEIKTLADYVKEPSREPLIGLEYVVEHRSPGKKTPTYSCELCDYKTELAPIVQHLIGFKHRKTYIGKEFPFLLKTPPGVKEDRIQFLRRMAQDIEKDEGVKKYKIDPGPKPEPLMSVKMPVEQLKPKTRWNLTQEEKTLQNKRALKFLETKFEIRSDAEAFSVMTVTEELSRTLKGYCFKQKAIAKANEINVEFANRVKTQKWTKEAKFTKQFTQAASQAIAQAAFLTQQYNSIGNRKIGFEGSGSVKQNPMIQISEADRRNPDYMMENQKLPYNYESENLNQRFMIQNRSRSGDRIWNRGLNQNPMVMQTQGGSYGFEDGNLNRDSLMRNQQIKPVLRGSGEDILKPEFRLQEQLQYASRINLGQEPVVLNRQAQLMKNQRALRAPNTLLYPMPPFGSSPGLSGLGNLYSHLNLPSAPAGDKSSYAPGERFEDSDLRRASRIQDNRRPFSGMGENWRQKPTQLERGDLPSQRVDIPSQRVYHPAVPSDLVSDVDVPFRFGIRPKKNDMLAQYASGRPQHNPLELHMIAEPPLNFLHDTFRKVPEDPRFGKITEKHSMNLPPEIVNRVRGKDVFTATAVLNQLAVHHPELQRLNIANLVKVLIDNRVIV